MINWRKIEIWCAVASLVSLGVIAAFGSVLVSGQPETIIGIISKTVLAVLMTISVAGFYFYMFADCIRSKIVQRKILWILLFLLLPIFSAHIYFIVTRIKSSADS